MDKLMKAKIIRRNFVLASVVLLAGMMIGLYAQGAESNVSADYFCFH